MQLVKIMSSRRKRTVAIKKEKKRRLRRVAVESKSDFTIQYCIDVFTHSLLLPIKEI